MNKKIMKRILIITGIIVGIFLLAFAGTFLKLSYEMSGITPVETGKIVDNIYVVKDDFSNIFIIQDSAQYIVIDCGTNQSTTAQQLENLGITPDDVSAVFLTHTDSDHTGALGLFEHAKLYLSEEEEQMIDGRKSKFLWLVKANPGISRNDYILLKDREITQIGDMKVEGILVPGHTSGTMAYLVNERYFFTGDILSLKDGKIAPIPAFFDMDNAQAIKSMEIVSQIPAAEYIFTAHWGYTDNYKTAVE